MTPRPSAPLPRGVWVLGFVSLLMDVSSEMVHALLPLYLVGSLGVSVMALGFIEGAAEATALIVKVFSGALSDAMGRRKPLAVVGYALGALSKPAFALANSWGVVVAARLVDRVGKGIRGAPRDALLADITPPAQRGAAFGLRQSLDTTGAFLGPLVATGLMLLWANDFRAVFAVAIVPGVLAVGVLVFGLREPPPAPAAARPNPLSRDALRQLTPAFWRVVALGAVFTLARFSEAFLVLRAPQVGIGLAWVPLAMVAMNAVYALAAYPLGALADRWPRGRLLALGLAVLIAADALLALATGPIAFGAGLLLWGLHMAATQGVLAAMVADTAPTTLRGTAFGVFNLASGLALLAASVLAGALWQGWGAGATFWAGAAWAGMALLLLPRLAPQGA